MDARCKFNEDAFKNMIVIHWPDVSFSQVCYRFFHKKRFRTLLPSRCFMKVDRLHIYWRRERQRHGVKGPIRHYCRLTAYGLHRISTKNLQGRKKWSQVRPKRKVSLSALQNALYFTGHEMRYVICIIFPNLSFLFHQPPRRRPLNASLDACFTWRKCPDA